MTRSENNCFKNKVKQIIDKAKSVYYRNAFQSCRNNLSSTWKLIKLLTSSKNNSSNITKIMWNNIEYVEDLEIADAFNQYFCSIAQDLTSELPNSNLDPISFLPPSNISSMFLWPVSPEECSKIIKNLKRVKQDKNCIPVDLFVQNHPYFLRTICEMINQSFSTGIFPSTLKIAITIPIFKKGDSNLISNYRPIAILPLLSKVFEKCISNRILNFISINNLISPAQFGFVKSRSTEDAILNVTEKIYSALNSKHHCINVFIDFAKAFDTVDHVILIRKLAHYGIRGLPLQLINSYLTNRTQRVKINGILSSSETISKGVPQGSVLGPLLFILFINDLPNLSDDYSTTLFADDATFCFSGKDITGLVSLCNAELTKFFDWSVCNKLTVNISKTNFLLISNMVSNSTHIDIVMKNRSITRKEYVTYLGVVLDEKVKFHKHTEYIGKKISRSIGVISRIKNLVPQNVLYNLYYTLIFPYFNYCNLVWCGTYWVHLNSIWLLQKRAIRLINLKPPRSHTNHLFIESKILKLPEIRLLKLGIFMFKNKDHPMFVRNIAYNFRSQDLLNTTFARLTSTEQSIFYAGPTMWNNLPYTLRNCSSVNSFKKELKSHLLLTYSE